MLYKQILKIITEIDEDLELNLNLSARDTIAEDVEKLAREFYDERYNQMVEKFIDCIHDKQDLFFSERLL